MWQAADGTGTVEALTNGSNTKNPTAVSPDGTEAVFTEIAQQSNEDVMQVSLTGSHEVVPLVRSPSAERNGVISPDGRWLAYEANDSGQFEIYVRPYPNVNSGHWQVSTGGGTRPLWSRDGEELFFVSPTAAILRVRVQRGTTWTVTTPSAVVREGYATAPAGNNGRNYDVSPDGRRFLVVKSAADLNATAAQLNVVQHFDQELKRLVPAK